jgi:hypothetical protein
MKHLDNNKRDNSIVTAATGLFTLAFFVVAVFLPIITTIQSAEASAAVGRIQIPASRAAEAAPAVVSGDNIYIAWWTNNTENGNEEVMFRASSDSGATFGDRINLSNTTDADSWRVELHGEGDTVIVSWWETNQTSDIPVARISNDAGETFGELIMLGANGTIGVTEEDGAAAEGETAAAEGGEGAEEEAAAANGGGE